MPSTPRGRDAATLLAVIVTIVLAFAWLRTSDGGAPAVPVGLSVGTVPTVESEEPAALGEATPPARGIEGERAGGGRTVRKARRERADRAAKHAPADREAKRERADRDAKRGHADRQAGHGHADRVGGAGEDDPASLLAGRLTRRQDPPATAPAPSVGGGGSAPPPTPEFALE